MEFVSAKLIFSAIILCFLLGYWVFNFVILYHLTRFGIGTQPKKLAAVFLLGAIVLFSASVTLFAGLDASSLKSQFQKLGGGVFSTTYLR